jgi:hypothetical protein
MNSGRVIVPSLQRKENCVRDSSDPNGGLMLAMLGSALLAGPVLGWWPLVGVVAACGSYIYVASLFRPRR